tara:strand:- start:1346 stop:1948 length:603 start_codon:yes stop_codon:yes gene_type:complete
MKIIIITGPSGSGKTSISKRLMLELENCHIISTDDFYKTGWISNIFSKIIESYFDRKISHNSKLLRKTINKIIKNKEINYSYKYDYIKKTTETTHIKSFYIKYLIIEGIFALELLKTISRNDYLLIRLKINKEICMKRINERDLIERGKSKIVSLEDFIKAWRIYHNKEKSYKIFDKDKELIFKEDPNINIILKRLSNKI